MSTRRKFDPTREELTRLYHEQGLSMGQIAVAHGVMPTTVRNALIRLEIPFKKNAGHRLTLPGSRALPPLDKELLERMYVRQGRSMADVASALGVGLQRIKTSLEQHGIPLREQSGPPPSYLSSEEVVRLYLAGWPTSRIAEFFFVNESRVRQILTEQEVPTRPDGKKRDDTIKRRGVAFEEVPMGQTQTGQLINRTVLRLECGHKTGLRRGRSIARKTDPTTIVTACKACRFQEEKDHG